MKTLEILNSILSKYGYELVRIPVVVKDDKVPVPIVTSAPAKSRGIRNNNPGNIDLPATWVGSSKGSDPRFCHFSNMAYGVRALALLMLHYQSHYGLRTIRQLINRWAPPVENDTGAYADAVGHDCGIPPDAPFNLEFPGHLSQICRAIVRQENGASSVYVTELAYSLGVGNALGMVAITDLEGYKDGA